MQELAGPGGCTRNQVLPTLSLEQILGSLVLSWEGGKHRTGTSGFVLAVVPSVLEQPRHLSPGLFLWKRKEGGFASKGKRKEKNPELAKAN